MTKFQPSTLLTTNHRTALKLKFKSYSLLIEGVDGQNFVIYIVVRLVRHCYRKNLVLKIQLY